MCVKAQRVAEGQAFSLAAKPPVRTPALRLGHLGLTCSFLSKWWFRHLCGELAPQLQPLLALGGI